VILEFLPVYSTPAGACKEEHLDLEREREGEREGEREREMCVYMYVCMCIEISTEKQRRQEGCRTFNGRRSTQNDL
jgi:hypothetical protein